MRVAVVMKEGVKAFLSAMIRSEQGNASEMKFRHSRVATRRSPEVRNGVPKFIDGVEHWRE